MTQSNLKNEKKQKSNTSLVDNLISIDKSKADLSIISRYWSEPTRYLSYPVLAKINAISYQTDFTPDSILAALYSIYPYHSLDGINFLSLLSSFNSNKDKDPNKKRLEILLSCNTLEEVAYSLHNIFSLLNTKQAINFTELHWDLINWTKNHSSITKKWALNYYKI